jgi:hypothetical protein
MFRQPQGTAITPHSTLRCSDAHDVEHGGATSRSESWRGSPLGA